MKPRNHSEIIKAWADGAEIEQRDPSLILLSMPPQPDPWRPFSGTWNEKFEYRVKPEMVHPETKMSGRALFDLYYTDDGCAEESFVVVANAVIRHAIDSGQVVPAEHSITVTEAFRAGAEGVTVARAARDMAIAEAVSKATYNKMRSDDPRRFAYCELDLDLAAIIAEVAP